MGIIANNACCQLNNKKEKEINDYDSKKIINFPFKTNIETEYATNSTFDSKIENKIILIQKFLRGFKSRLKFKDRLELYSNILSLDKSVNLIPKENINNLLKNNKGEQTSLNLIEQKIIQPFTQLTYYKNNIKKYKLNNFLLETDFIFIDKYESKNIFYKGTWTLEKKFHGYGIYYINSAKYEGFWEFGKLNGYIRYFVENGDYYLGNFVNGFADGYGKYIHSDGTIYKGYFKENKLNGYGIEIYKDQSCFKGIFKNGKKIKGKFSWKDGSFYEGEILNNLFDGYGKFSWKEGRIYEGEWFEGKMDGKGKTIYSDGSIYMGDYNDGKRDGLGKYIWNENKYYEGFWRNNKHCGLGILYKNGKVTKGNWTNEKIVEIDNDININNNNNEYENIDILKSEASFNYLGMQNSNRENSSRNNENIYNSKIINNININSNKSITETDENIMKNNTNKVK